MAERSEENRLALERLGRAFAVQRRAVGKSRFEVEGLSGVTERFIGSLERGSANPSYLTLRALARAVGMDLSALVAAAETADA